MDSGTGRDLSHLVTSAHALQVAAHSQCVQSIIVGLAREGHLECGFADCEGLLSGGITSSVLQGLLGGQNTKMSVNGSNPAERNHASMH